MEDLQIIELYFKRNEAAIDETANKYGAFCRSVAKNILTLEEDAEECVNDAYLRAWSSIPPQRPAKLGSWLSRVVRNIALDMWRKSRRQKRYSGMEQLLDELNDCVPSSQNVECEIDKKELTEAINAWLGGLGQNDRVLFMRRYYGGEAVLDLAKECGLTPGGLAKKLYKLRQSLKASLEKEGYSL